MTVKINAARRSPEHFLHLFLGVRGIGTLEHEANMANRQQAPNHLGHIPWAAEIRIYPVYCIYATGADRTDLTPESNRGPQPGPVAKPLETGPYFRSMR